MTFLGKGKQRAPVSGAWRDAAAAPWLRPASPREPGGRAPHPAPAPVAPVQPWGQKQCVLDYPVWLIKGALWPSPRVPLTCPSGGCAGGRGCHSPCCPPSVPTASRPGCPQPVTTHGRGPRAGPFPLDPRPPSQPLGSGTAPPVRGLPSAAWWSGVLPSRPLLLPYAVHHRSHAASPRPHASSLLSHGRAHNKPLANFPLASVSWRTQTDKCSRLYIQRKWGGGARRETRAAAL